MAVKYISAEEAAKKWNIASERVVKGCETGQIENAAIFNNNWLIPEDMEKPRLRFKREKKDPESVSEEQEHNNISKEQRYKESIYQMTMQGFPDFEITEHKFGKRTIMVSRCYAANTNETIETLFMRYVLDKMDKDNLFGAPLSFREKEKIIDKVREGAISKMQPSEKLRKYYYDKFTEIGYSDEEMKALMEKIDEHIANRNKNFGIK